ncbi:MG284/MPN403 family protein [Mycoplasma sp. 2575]
MLENKIKNLKSMSLQRKRAFIIDFCLNQKLKRIQNNMKDTRNVGLLDFFISSLSEDYKKIFINDFITIDSDSSWYLENWSKNAYYKKLNYLVDLFIDYVYCF